MSSDETFSGEFDLQLGPFYASHGEEIIPSGYEESGDRLIETMGNYRLKSNIQGLPGLVRIGTYDLTRYIQEDWDRLSPELGSSVGEFPRRGFLMSSRSASQAAGRAAEEIVLEKILWRVEIDGRSGQVFWFYDAVDQGLIVKPKGVGSDDFLLRFDDNEYALVESKASFRGKVDRYVEKASRQLAITCEANNCIRFVMLALIDLNIKTVRIVLLDREQFLNSPLIRLREALRSLE